MTPYRILSIDLGVNKLAWAVTDQNHLIDSGAHVVKHLGRLRSSVLRELADEMLAVAQEYVVHTAWIETIIVGNNRKYSLGLAQVYGAVASALAEYCGVYDVDNRVWKKDIIGNGNADKQKIRSWLESSHPDYAEACEGDQDRIDAVCVGLYAQAIMGRADGLRLEDD